MMESTQKRKRAVMLIIERDGRYLFIRRALHDTAGGFWCPISGGVEDDETLEQAIVREAWEEVGLEVRPREQIAALVSQNGEYLFHWWTVELVSGEAHVKEPLEIDDVRWVHPDDFDTLTPCFADNMELIRRLAAKR